MHVTHIFYMMFSFFNIIIQKNGIKEEAEKRSRPLFDFRIDTFLAVCKHMNFTRAAEELHITQPAVSQHIQYLEKLYGLPLFSHMGKKTVLTPAGKILLSAVSTMKSDEQVMRQQMHRATEGKVTLILGVTMTVGEYLIAPLIAKYLKHHPDADIHIRRGNTAQLLSYLEQGEIHLAFVEGYLPADDYDTLPYRAEKFIPVCNAAHKFAGEKKPRQLVDLLPERLLVREQGSGTRDILDKNLAVMGLRISDFVRLAEIESMHTIVSLLLEDCGISFLYRIAVENELADGRLREIFLDDFHMVHDLTFAWNKGSIHGDLYRNVCRELSEL